MDKIRFLIALLITLLMHNTCSADLNLKLLNIWSLLKTNTTIEHLDHGHYKNTQVTSDWTSDKEVSFYTLTPELVWTINPCHTYVKLAGNYGWVLDGKGIQYPFRWELEGDTKGFDVEVGYIYDVNGLFKLLPHVGFNYNVYDIKIKNQEFSHKNIYSFLKQNGNKSHSLLYFPYIGFEVAFKSKLCNKDVQCSFAYNFGYGGGHNKLKVPHTVITDLPSTSRYGYHVKYRDLVTHDLEFAIAYSPCKKWIVALEFDYNIFYNTHKLPLELDHNREIVAAAQYTRSQHHAVSDFVGREYSIILGISYSLSGEGGTFVTH